MAEQALWRSRRTRQSANARTRTARLALMVLWVLSVACFAWAMYRVLSVESPTGLQLVFWVLSTLCFAWVAVGSITAVLGFISLASRTTCDTLVLPDASALPREKTALLVPVYREDTDAVCGIVETLCRELTAAGAAAAFDVFILSDTQDEAERVQERRAYLDLCARNITDVPIYVRWRTPNTAKKSGNIRDWIERFGAAYPYFLVLDADSVMTPEALIRLARAMEISPHVGLIQTVPRLIGGTTLFARLQQFASCYYGPILAAGLAAWHGHGGNYWGHNAIIRTAAFAASAGLPPLPGKPPLGGHILSHDFVEAALLRRAGWEVHLVPSLEGSFEGCPPSLSDLITRDRRWAQGNLQHLRLLGVHGLPFLSRLHLAMGAVSYLASPVWAMTLLVGIALAFQAKYATPIYFGTEASLFPKWPVFDAQLALTLFAVTIVFVHLPKILGTAWALRSSEQRRRHGGVLRVVSGALLESVASTLMAPILMLTQTSAVIGILLGGDTGWGAQRRVASTAGLAAFVRQHAWHLAWGLAGALICWSISLAVFAWMSPVVIGLLLAAPIALLTGRRAGRATAFLLATLYERQQPVLAEQASDHPTPASPATP